MAFLRKHALLLTLVFFFCLYHSNRREEGSPEDTQELKLSNFARLVGDDKIYGEAGKELGDAKGWASGYFKEDKPPFAILPFFPLDWAYWRVGCPIRLFWVNFLGKFCAVLYALATLALFYGIALNLGASERVALLSIWAFGAATHIWDGVSLGFWTSTGFVPFFALGLYFVTRPKIKARELFFSGLFLGYAVACRHQDALLTLPFLAYVVWKKPKQAYLALVPFGAGVGLVVLWNLHQWGNVLGTYGPGGRAASHDVQVTGHAYGLTGDLRVGLPAILFSPGRGLFVFSPILIFPFFWLKNHWAVLKKKKFTLLHAALGSILLEFLLIGKFNIWWGGYSWGPRLLVSALPAFFVLFMLTLPKKVSQLTVVLLAAAFAWGVFVQGLGAYKYHMWVWNWRPMDIDLAPQRVWDFRDNPIRRAWGEAHYTPSNYSLEY